MKNLTVNFENFAPASWLENLGLSVESIDVTDLETKKPEEKLFAGFSSVKELPNIEEKRYDFDYKHAQYYLAQLAVKHGVIKLHENEKEYNDEFSFPSFGNMHEWSNYYYLDLLSEAWGLEENTLRNSGWGFCYLGERFNLTEEQKAERYHQVAKFFGFMNSIALDESLVALRSINEKAKSGFGHNSPRTGKFVHEYNIIRFGKEKYNSPYKLEKMIWAVVSKAKSKHGVKVSFNLALEALGISKQTSKAATVAAAVKLGLYRELKDSYGDPREIKSYREARELLIEYLKAKKEAVEKGSEVFWLPQNNDKLVKYAYRTDSSYTIVFDGVDYYRNNIDIEEPEIAFFGTISYKWEDISTEEWRQYYWDNTHRTWNRILKTSYRFGMKVEKAAVIGLCPKYDLYTEFGVIRGNSFKEAYQLYLKRVQAEKLNSVIGNLQEYMEAPETEGMYLFFTDSTGVGNCSAGTRAMMYRLGIPKNALIFPIREIWNRAIDRAEWGSSLLKKALANGLVEGYKFLGKEL